MKEGKGNAVFSVIGAASGLGNAFRFPLLCAQYGLAFALVYACMLVAVCLPLLCAELYFGKRFSGGKGEKVWRAVLRLATVNSAFIALYYGVISAKLGSAGASFAVFAGDSGESLRLFSAVIILVLAAVFFILRKGSGALARTGKLSVLFSLALFTVLAVTGFAHGNRLPSLNFTCLAGGAVWADALGQALLALSLASGVMPSFARVHRVKVVPAALSIIICNFLGCALSALATAPYIPLISQTVGVNCGLELYKTAVFTLFSGKIVRSMAGTAVFAVLTLVAIHSLCSLAYPFVSSFKGNKNLAPACFCLLTAVCAPLFLSGNLQVLGACDRMACSVTAVVIAFAECLFFASQRHIRGVTGFFTRFFCPVITGALALFSLCSARFDCFTPLATVTAYISITAVALTAALPRLTFFVKRFKISLRRKEAGEEL